MKIIPIVLIFFLFFFSRTAEAQNAPVTKCGIVFSSGPTVVVPITVTNFIDIVAVSLTLDYNFSIAQITGISPNVNLPGFTADWTSNPGRIGMSWYGSSGVNLPDDSVLVNISFTGLVAGETALTWFDNGSSCEYAMFNGGNFIVLNDSPTGDYYINGHITKLNGPQTVAPVINSAVPNQVVCIPITVNHFNNIGSIALTLDYDPSILIFQSTNSSTIPGTWFLSGMAAVPGRLIFGGYGPGISIPDGDTLFNACFFYNGGTSTLAWYDASGSECEYSDATTFAPLPDTPQNLYYIDGLITSPFLADFIADNTLPPRNTTVQFTDLTTGSPTSWDWSFDRTSIVYVNGTDAHSRNPQVQFTEGGPYTVTLTAHNAFFTDSKVKVGYIWAGTPGLWTGETSTAWYLPTNWDNWLYPYNEIDVVIPASAPNWPVYIGNLTIGVQCKTITLQAISSKLTVTGNLTIMP